MRFPNISRKMASFSTDIEKAPEQPQATSYGILDGPGVTREPHIQNVLTQFRHYVGIHNDPDLAADRPVANLGIYQRIVKQEQKYKKQFNVFSWLINSALGLQIVFAAALTALGAGNGPRSAVTAFGALNTIIAGFLTYLKGSGLPHRLKYYKDELSKTREYIEQREREFARGDTTVDLKSEVAVIEEMYQSVRREIEMNTPEAFVSRTRDVTRDSMAHIERLSARGRRDYDDRLSYVDDKVHSVRRGLESRLSEARLGVEAKYRDTRNGIDDRLSNAKYSLEKRLSQERVGVEARLMDARQGIETQYQQSRAATAAQIENTRHGLESRMDDTRSSVTAQIEESRHGMESRLKEIQTQVKEQEDKMMSMAENVAEKVLSVTQRRHDGDRK